mgnify:CR=1 FL=1
MTFCQRLFQYDNNVGLEWKTNKHWGDKIKVEESDNSVLLFEYMARAMADVFIKHREINWIRQIVKNCYYYSNKEEVGRIVEITYSMISDGAADLEQIIKDNKPRDYLLKLFRDNVKQKNIHFDSIVNFRFQQYKSELIDLVGIAIDEFKREEDYQSFIQSLREYIAKKEPKYSIVHILQGNDFTFFKSDGQAFSNMELKMLIQREPLYIVGLDEEELNLTPLLAMAPREVRIYGDNPTDAKTLTVINIFQEKVEMESAEKFPFSYFQNN